MLSLKVMDYHVMVWKVCGLWTLPGNPLWYRVYCIALYTIFYVLYPLCIGLALMFTENVNEMIDILLILPTACAGVKGCFVIAKRRELRKLFVLMDRMDEMVKKCEYVDLIEKALGESLTLVKVLSLFYYSTCVSSFIVPILVEERRLIWPSYYFVDYTNNVGAYYFFLFFQWFSSFLVSFIYSSLDLYAAALYKMLGAHIDILGMRLRAIGRLEGGPKKCVKRIEMNLKECAVYHTMCIQYSAFLNDILSHFFLFQFGTSGLVFCGSEFKISTLHPVDDFTDFLFLFLYILSMTYQIFIPCYFGSIVSQKSEQLPTNLLESNWLDGTASMRRSVTIIGERVNRPITPFAGGLFVVGLPTFVSIMKTAYSLMAFLKNVESQQE